MGRLEMIQDEKRWSAVLKRFSCDDIYFQYHYAKALELHGDGLPILIYYSGNNVELCYVVMKKDISLEQYFCKRLERNTYFDLETPYGYGGPLIKGKLCLEEEKDFFQKLTKYCQCAGIVSQFIRFYPLIYNQDFFHILDNKKMLRNTVYIDTSDEEMIIKNMDTKNRNMIRKAGRNNIQIISDQGERLDEFINVYNETMNYHNAETYYTFDKTYYQYLLKNCKNQIIFFYGCYEGKIISAAMFFYGTSFMHYHLSGAKPEFRNLASMNLLLFEAARWANKTGIVKLHLGGGMSDHDSLYGFKKQFNKKGYTPFYIGKSIFDHTKYNKLLEIRKQEESEFDKDNNFFIQYRK